VVSEEDEPTWGFSPAKIEAGLNKSGAKQGRNNAGSLYTCFETGRNKETPNAKQRRDLREDERTFSELRDQRCRARRLDMEAKMMHEKCKILKPVLTQG
jgi:hypothetical protein